MSGLLITFISAVREAGNQQWQDGQKASVVSDQEVAHANSLNLWQSPAIAPVSFPCILFSSFSDLCGTVFGNYEFISTVNVSAVTQLWPGSHAAKSTQIDPSMMDCKDTHTVRLLRSITTGTPARPARAPRAGSANFSSTGKCRAFAGPVDPAPIHRARLGIRPPFTLSLTFRMVSYLTQFYVNSVALGSTGGLADMANFRDHRGLHGRSILVHNGWSESLRESSAFQHPRRS